MGNFFTNLKAQFFPPKQANPVITRPSGLVQTVISRSNTLTGVKQPISKTPTRLQPINVGAPVTRDPVERGMPDRVTNQ